MMRVVVRTTLDIESDVLSAAKELARLQNVSTGQIVSKLLRQALSGIQKQPCEEAAGVGLFRPFAVRERWVTDELVNQLRDQ